MKQHIMKRTICEKREINDIERREQKKHKKNKTMIKKPCTMHSCLKKELIVCRFIHPSDHFNTLEFRRRQEINF